MKNMLRKIGLIGAGIGLLLGAVFMTSGPTALAQTANFWTQNALNSLATNTSGGLANADIHVRHCYIGLGTGTPCGGGGGSLAIGDPVSGGTNYAPLSIDGSGNLADPFGFSDPTGNVSMDFQQRKAWDATGLQSIDWKNRQLSDINGIVTLDYEDTTGVVTFGDQMAGQPSLSLDGSTATATLTGGVGGGLTAYTAVGQHVSSIFGSINGALSKMTNVGNSQGFVGAANLVGAGYASDSAVLAHENISGDGSYIVAYDSGGAERIDTITQQFGTKMITSQSSNSWGNFGTNGNGLAIDDSGQTVSANAGANFRVADTAGNRFLFVPTDGSGPIQIGDVDGAFSSGRLSIDGNTGTAVSSNLSWDFGGVPLNNIQDPTLAQDAATKAYVDSVAIGLSWKNAVNAATTGALPAYTYLSGVETEVGNGALPAQDGVTLTVGQRLLEKDETGGNAPFNGIYVVTAVGSGGAPFVLTRSSDANTGALLVAATVSVPAGSVNANMAFTQTTPATITIGVTPIVWVAFLNNIYTAGLGLTLTGHSFSLDLAHANHWFALQQFDSGFFQLNGSSSGFMGINAAATTTPYSIFMPAAQGANHTTLHNDGAGNLTWGLNSLTTDVSGILPVVNGGTGLGTLTLHDLMVGNGTSTPTFIAPGTSGNILTSNGTSWTSAAPAAPTSYTGMVESISMEDATTGISGTTYTLELYAGYGYTINTLHIQSASGTATAALQINGTPVTSCSAVSVTNTISNTTCTAANTVVAGNKVTLVISSPTALNDLTASVTTTRT